MPLNRIPTEGTGEWFRGLSSPSGRQLTRGRSSCATTRWRLRQEGSRRGNATGRSRRRNLVSVVEEIEEVFGSGRRLSHFGAVRVRATEVGRDEGVGEHHRNVLTRELGVNEMHCHCKLVAVEFALLPDVGEVPELLDVQGG